MSPANVYRFFPSKSAIVEAICQRCLSELDTKAWAVARSPGSAASRLERLFVEIFSYHRDNLITEKRVHDVEVWPVDCFYEGENMLVIHRGVHRLRRLRARVSGGGSSPTPSRTWRTGSSSTASIPRRGRCW